MHLSEPKPETREPQAAPTPAGSQELSQCTTCSNGVLARQDVRTAFWEGERLVVVEGIPALVCQSCGEQFYEDETAMKLDLMRGAGFSADKAVRDMTVSVFTFGVPDASETADKANAQK